jgi:hypothetical protein
MGRVQFGNIDLRLTVNRHSNVMDRTCKHPKVRIVAREEDAEYVECQECGEVFDSNEFHDMAIEEEGEKERTEA